MQPVRKVLSATHFKPTEVEGKVKWTPCSPGDRQAVERSWTEIESDELQEPALRLTDFERALESTRPTVTSEDIQKHQKWTNDSGRSSSRSIGSLPNDFPLFQVPTVLSVHPHTVLGHSCVYIAVTLLFFMYHSNFMQTLLRQWRRSKPTLRPSCQGLSLETPL
jgi:hypothetical protein